MPMLGAFRKHRGIGALRHVFEQISSSRLPAQRTPGLLARQAFVQRQADSDRATRGEHLSEREAVRAIARAGEPANGTGKVAERHFIRYALKSRASLTVLDRETIEFRRILDMLITLAQRTLSKMWRGAIRLGHRDETGNVVAGAMAINEARSHDHAANASGAENGLLG